MKTRILGTDGPALSTVGLGCNNFGSRVDRETSITVARAALDAGITHFDTAERYGEGLSEEYLGEALSGRRDEAVIATKFEPRPDGEPYVPGVLTKRIRTACEQSLRRLRTDRIDLYYQHYPDADAPIDETLEALAELVSTGKVLHVATSNVSSQQLREALDCASAKALPRFVGAQFEWNLIARDVETSLVPAATAGHVGIVPFYPLASGLLTGKYQHGEAFPAGSRFARSPERFALGATEENFDRVERLIAFSAAQGHSIIELAVSWLLAQPGVASVICGATSPEQVTVNAAAGNWTLNADQLVAVPV